MAGIDPSLNRQLVAVVEAEVGEAMTRPIQIRMGCQHHVIPSVI